jgi:Kef-type K+ transport system membrane component KefB
MKETLGKVFKAFSIELLIYAVLVVAYILLVLHFLGGWLSHLFNDDRKLYAAVALILIVTQGFLLEIVARRLLGLVKGKPEE